MAGWLVNIAQCSKVINNFLQCNLSVSPLKIPDINVVYNFLFISNFSSKFKTHLKSPLICDSYIGNIAVGHN